MPSPYEQFREAVLKAASPEHKAEILELKFGCKVKMTENTKLERIIFGKIIDYSIPYDGGILKNWYIKPDNKSKIENFGEIGINGFTNNVEIIGRDLTLEDVLRVLENKCCDETIGISYNGDFLNCDDDLHNLRFIGIKWQPTKPAHLQSDETLLEIIKILSV